MYDLFDISNACLHWKAALCSAEDVFIEVRFFFFVVDRLDNVSERYLVLHHTGATAFGMSGYMI